MSALKVHRAGGMQRAGLMAEDTSRADGPLSQVESGLTAAATFAHRQIEFVRPHSAANARAPSVADNNAATKSTVVNKHGDEVSISVYRPANDAAATVNSKDDFKEPSLSLFKAERIEAWLKWKNVRSIGCGLNNLGNTCFLNAALQCLTYTPSLANYLSTHEHSQSCRIKQASQGNSFCMMCSMERLQAEVFQSNGRPFTPSSIVKNIRVIGPRFRPGRQEDSHEFIRLALEAMHKNALANSAPTKDERVKETSVIHRIFGGYFRSQVRCESCGFCSNTYDAFLDLSLDVYKLASVDRALQAFTKTDYLEGDNAYKCSKCSQRVRAAKRLSVHRAPPVLTIHLKRFQFVQMFGGAKINKPIAFPETLDMSPYMSFPKAARRDGTHIYKLHGVLVHSGSSTDCGHYYSFVRAPNDGWFRCDDSSVSRVSLDKVLEQQAYILFYTRQGQMPSSDKPAESQQPSSATAPTNVMADAEMGEAVSARDVMRTKQATSAMQAEPDTSDEEESDDEEADDSDFDSNSDEESEEDDGLSELVQLFRRVTVPVARSLVENSRKLFAPLSEASRRALSEPETNPKLTIRRYFPAGFRSSVTGLPQVISGCGPIIPTAFMPSSNSKSSSVPAVEETSMSVARRCLSEVCGSTEFDSSPEAAAELRRVLLESLPATLRRRNLRLALRTVNVIMCVWLDLQTDSTVSHHNHGSEDPCHCHDHQAAKPEPQRAAEPAVVSVLTPRSKSSSASNQTHTVGSPISGDVQSAKPISASQPTQVEVTQSEKPTQEQKAAPAATPKQKEKKTDAPVAETEAFDPRAFRRQQNMIDFATRMQGWGDDDTDAPIGSHSNGHGVAVGVAASEHAARVALTKSNDELRHPHAGKRKRDAWDVAYDQGKVKKVKNKDAQEASYRPAQLASNDGNGADTNPFQRASDHIMADKAARKEGRSPAPRHDLPPTQRHSGGDSPFHQKGFSGGGRGGFQKGFSGGGRGGFQKGFSGGGRGGFQKSFSGGGRGGFQKGGNFRGGFKGKPNFK